MSRLIAALLALSTAFAQDQPRFTDRVDVRRLIIDARALDGQSQAILGLTPDDFTVTIEGHAARVESATWVGTGAEPGAADPAGTTAAGSLDARDLFPRGRLVVFLFQKDLEPSRIFGLMRMLFRAKTFLDSLEPDDRVAVVSFDSHLKIWLDFTGDREAVRQVLERGLLLQSPKPIGEGTDAISLTRRLSQAAGRKAYPFEKALLLIGEALEPLPGAKSIVLFGHGFGRYTSNGVVMERGYGDALAALHRARASVFSIDVTMADYHSLEVGLQSIAQETGGFYERSFHFPDRAVRRLAGALAGYYVLIVESSDRDVGWSDLSVKLARREGSVLARKAAESR